MVEVEENEYMLPTSGFLPLAGRLVNWLWFLKKNRERRVKSASEKGKRRGNQGSPSSLVFGQGAQKHAPWGHPLTRSLEQKPLSRIVVPYQPAQVST